MPDTPFTRASAQTSTSPYAVVADASEIRRGHGGGTIAASAAASNASGSPATGGGTNTPGPWSARRSMPGSLNRPGTGTYGASAAAAAASAEREAGSRSAFSGRRQTTTGPPAQAGSGGAARISVGSGSVLDSTRTAPVSTTTAE